MSFGSQLVLTRQVVLLPPTLDVCSDCPIEHIKNNSQPNGVLLTTTVISDQNTDLICSVLCMSFCLHVEFGISSLHFVTDPSPCVCLRPSKNFSCNLI